MVLARIAARRHTGSTSLECGVHGLAGCGWHVDNVRCNTTVNGKVAVALRAQLATRLIADQPTVSLVNA